MGYCTEHPTQKLETKVYKKSLNQKGAEIETMSNTNREGFYNQRNGKIVGQVTGCRKIKEASFIIEKEK